MAIQLSSKFKKFGVMFLVVIGLVGAWYGLNKFGLLNSPGSSSSVSNTDSGEDAEMINEDKPINVGVVTWPGYVGGQYFNRGFKDNEQSMFRKKYGIAVNFIVNDDFVSSREMWKSGEIDVLWITADAFPTESKSLEKYKPTIFFAADKSNGGDAIVSVKGINTVNDLKGKKVAVAFGTPSHTFLIWLLEAAGLKYSDIQVVQAPSAIDAATYFKSGQVDAAVVWSPDDKSCVSAVKGSKILSSTREANNIIVDVFYAKEGYIKENKELLVKFVQGWLEGVAEVNTNETAKNTAIDILTEGLQLDKAFFTQTINNVRLATYGDNKNFFGLNPDYKGITGEYLYTTMAKKYNAINLAPFNVPSWSEVSTTEIINLVKLSGPEHEAEGVKTFTKKENSEIKKSDVVSTKGVTINFASGSSTLDENAKIIIDMEFGSIGQGFANLRIRLSGNTDNVGSVELNRQLSYDRAKSVGNYLVQKFGFDPNRFVIVGNGSDNPIGSNSTPEGRAKNRRTDLELIAQ